ncbi:hypothetical protein ABKV19_017415 [Rosa sericea]
MKVLKYRSLPFLGGSNYSISLRRIQSLSLITDAVKISLPHHRRRIDLSPSDAATRILSSRSRVGNRSPPKQGCLGIAFRFVFKLFQFQSLMILMNIWVQFRSGF